MPWVLFHSKWIWKCSKEHDEENKNQLCQIRAMMHQMLWPSKTFNRCPCEFQRSPRRNATTTQSLIVFHNWLQHCCTLKTKQTAHCSSEAGLTEYGWSICMSHGELLMFAYFKTSLSYIAVLSWCDSLTVSVPWHLQSRAVIVQEVPAQRRRTYTVNPLVTGNGNIRNTLTKHLTDSLILEQLEDNSKGSKRRLNHHENTVRGAPERLHIFTKKRPQNEWLSDMFRHQAHECLRVGVSYLFQKSSEAVIHSLDTHRIQSRSGKN